MRLAPATAERRLVLLNQADLSHNWKSCDELRYCTRCECEFTGFEVKVSWFRRGMVRLHCPTPFCPAGPAAWVHPANPLISEEAWEDWDRIIRETEAAAS